MSDKHNVYRYKLSVIVLYRDLNSSSIALDYEVSDTTHDAADYQGSTHTSLLGSIDMDAVDMTLFGQEEW